MKVKYWVFTSNMDLLCAWLRIKLSTTCFGSYPSLPQPTVGNAIDLAPSLTAICRQADIIESSIYKRKRQQLQLIQPSLFCVKGWSQY